MAANSLRRLTSDFPTQEEVSLLIKGLENESDRALAIISGSLLDHALQIWLTMRMLHFLSQTEKNQLFDYDAPLASFSAKIRICYALGFYGKITRDNLICIQRIRNVFAHSTHIIDFSIPSVIDRINKINVSESQFQLIGEGTPKTPRDKFLSITKALWVQIHRLARASLPPPTDNLTLM